MHFHDYIMVRRYIMCYIMVPWCTDSTQIPSMEQKSQLSDNVCQTCGFRFVFTFNQFVSGFGFGFARACDKVYVPQMIEFAKIEEAKQLI